MTLTRHPKQQKHFKQDAVAFKNNPRRAVYGDRGADISVLNCAFVNNTFDAEVMIYKYI